MNCCKKPKSQDSDDSESQYGQKSEQASKEQECEEFYLRSVRTFDEHTSSLPYIWYPAMHNVKNIDYVNKMESEFMGLQKAFLALTTHFARIQFRLRQIMNAAPEERYHLLLELEKIAFEGADDNCSNEELPHIQRDFRYMGEVRHKQRLVIRRLRNQLTSLCEASEMEGPNFTPEDMCVEDSYAQQQSGSFTIDEGKKSNLGSDWQSSSESTNKGDEKKSKWGSLRKGSGSFTKDDEKKSKSGSDQHIDDSNISDGEMKSKSRSKSS